MIDLKATEVAGDRPRRPRLERRPTVERTPYTALTTVSNGGDSLPSMSRAPSSLAGAWSATVALTLLLAAPARSDSYGLLRAYVSDEEGRPLPNSVVKITPPGLTATSDASGIVRIRLKARSYELSASRGGYEADVLAGVELGADSVKDVLLVLRVKGTAAPVPASAPR